MKFAFSFYSEMYWIVIFQESISNSKIKLCRFFFFVAIYLEKISVPNDSWNLSFLWEYFKKKVLKSCIQRFVLLFLKKIYTQILFILVWYFEFIKYLEGNFRNWILMIVQFASNILNCICVQFIHVKYLD